MPILGSSGWVWISDVELEEIAECGCDLCGRISEEGTLTDRAVRGLPQPDRNAPIHGEREQTLQLVVSDFDRRREHWWGRFLLWALRKTT